MLNRSVEKSEAAIVELKNEFGTQAEVSFIRMDLSVLDSVREAAKEVIKTVSSHRRADQQRCNCAGAGTQVDCRWVRKPAWH